jgi:hypothetical protein
MKSLFFAMVAAMLARRAEATQERCYTHRVETNTSTAASAAHKEALLKEAILAPASSEEEAAAWAEWEAAEQAAEQAAEAAAAEGRRLEAEVAAAWGRWREVAQKCRPPARRLRTRGAAIAAALEGLETALEELSGSCGGSLIYEEKMEKLKEESISILARLMRPGEFAGVILDYGLEEYFDPED